MIFSFTAIDDIVASATAQIIVACTTKQPVFTQTAFKLLTSLPPDNYVTTFRS